MNLPHISRILMNSRYVCLDYDRWRLNHGRKILQNNGLFMGISMRICLRTSSCISDGIVQPRALDTGGYSWSVSYWSTTFCCSKHLQNWDDNPVMFINSLQQRGKFSVIVSWSLGCWGDHPWYEVSTYQDVYPSLLCLYDFFPVHEMKTPCYSCYSCSEIL